MKINLETVYNGFFFLEDISLVRGKPAVEVDLTNRSDSFIKTIAIGTCMGTLKSSIDTRQLINLIKDKKIKTDLLFTLLGERVDEEFEITEVVIADVEVVEEDIDEIAEEDSIDDESQSNPFEEILNGSNKVVISKIKNADLTEEQKEELIKLESTNRNRLAVLNAIKES